MYHGDIRLSQTINIKFCTVQVSGAPFTLAGSPVISAYPSNSTTQLTAGITLSVDFDGVTGLNNIAVVASGANGYLTATDYALVITTGTVNSVSVVGYTVGSFSIENRSALMPTTAARTLVVDASGLADATMVKAGPSGAATAVYAYDFTCATDATADGTALTLPTTDSASVAIPNDASHAGKEIRVVGGTGTGQIITLQTRVGSTRQWLVYSGSQTTQTDNTSQCVWVDRKNIELAVKALLPTALVGGRMSSSVGAINGTAVNGDGSGTPWGP